jgi:hypothetical protein
VYLEVGTIELTLFRSPHKTLRNCLYPNCDVCTHQEAHRRARNLGLLVAREIFLSLFKPVLTRLKLLQQYAATENTSEKKPRTTTRSHLCNPNPSQIVTLFDSMQSHFLLTLCTSARTRVRFYYYYHPLCSLAELPTERYAVILLNLSVIRNLKSSPHQNILYCWLKNSISYQICWYTRTPLTHQITCSYTHSATLNATIARFCFSWSYTT